MAIDLYAPCPCGSGKKIKFCCRDLAGEIEKIERLLEAGQRQACLDHIERLEKKFPGRPYLMATKSSIQRELGRAEEAGATLERLLSEEQANPIALAESVLLALEAAEEDPIPAAIAQLQQAIEVSGEDWSDKVLEAVAAVADVSVRYGYLLVGLGHTMLYLSKVPDDEAAQRAAMQYFNAPQVPLLIKERRRDLPAPEDAAWKARYEEALLWKLRGRWQRARERLDELLHEHADQPCLWHSLATLCGWLGDYEAMADALRRYAALDVPVDDAVEAEALALTVRPPETRYIDQVRFEYPVLDMESLIGRLTSAPRLVRLEFERPAEEGPPPKARYALLDRPALDETAELPAAADEIPRVMCLVELYGKETDREARLELEARRDERLSDLRSAIEDASGDALGEAGEGVTVDALPEFEVLLLDDFWWPPAVSTDQREDLWAEYRDRVILEQWTTMPSEALDGKTPAEAASDPAYRNRLPGMILAMEASQTQWGPHAFDYDQLRARLGLPVPEPVDPTDVDLDALPTCRFARLKMESLDDEDLIFVLSRSLTHRANAAAAAAATEAETRDSLGDKLSRYGMFVQLATRCDDPRTALEFVQKAARFAKAEGESTAQCDLIELSLRLRRREAPEVERLLAHIQREHIDEPGVRSGLMQLLIAFGVITPEGVRPAHDEEPAAATAEAAPGGEAAGKIWTPGGDEPQSEKPAIWTPD